ncbi:MAG: cation transporter [Ruminococcaceae bacterium]|nr:cation transporter [Oscillospiraceae bacterium]
MINLLAKLFIKDKDNIKDPKVRHAYGMLMSIVGIVTNLVLSMLKLVFGTLCGSIAVTADALNNLSDAGSQIISLISFKISSKPADRDHPFGHARIEYVASMIVSFLVLLVGWELMSESIAKIIEPVKADFSNAVIIVLCISIAGKLWLGFSGKRVAKRIGSSVIRATSADSLSDAIATSAVLVSALISRFTGFQTDAYMGAAVSVVIMIAGIKILNDTKNSILGSPPDPEIIEAIRSITAEYPEILGIHDLVVHNYGPGNTIASLHAEVDGKEDVYLIHDVIDNAEKKLYEQLGVRATIHMDPIVTGDERVNELRALTLEAVKQIDSRLNIHDFRFVQGPTHSNLIFDVTAPFEVKLSNANIIELTQQKISKINPDFFAVITVDRE